jgi:hypothetical protein
VRGVLVGGIEDGREFDAGSPPMPHIEVPFGEAEQTFGVVAYRDLGTVDQHGRRRYARAGAA